MSYFSSMENLLKNPLLCYALPVSVVAYWVALVVWPPLSDFYSIPAQLLATISVILTGLYWWKLPQTQGINSARWFGLIVVCVLFSRYVGEQSQWPLMLIALCGLFVFMGEVSARLFRARASTFPADLMLVALVAVAACSAVHGVAQYFWLYDGMLADFLRANAGKSLDAVQEGIVHHLKLKRVGSVFGDPNVLGTMLALGVTASLELMRRWRTCKPLAVVGAVSVLASVACLPLTGSRGGMLATVVGVGIFLLGWFKARGEKPQSSLAPEQRVNRNSVVLTLYWFLLFLAVLSSAYGDLRRGSIRAETARVGRIAREGVPEFVLPAKQDAAPGGVSSRISRWETIQERANYCSIGWQMFVRAPFLGNGAGSVEGQYGRYKSVEARETKTLHNWPLQWLVEVGLVGTAFYLLFLGCVFAGVSRLARPGPWYGLTACAAVLLVDGLWSLSLSNTAIVGVFGLLIGLLCGAGARIPTDDETAQIGGINGSKVGAFGRIIWVFLALCVIFYLWVGGSWVILIALFGNGQLPIFYVVALVVAAGVLVFETVCAFRRKSGVYSALSCGGGLILLMTCGGLFGDMATRQYNLAELRDAVKQGDLEYAKYLTGKMPRDMWDTKSCLALADYYTAIGDAVRADEEMRRAAYNGVLDSSALAACAEYRLRQNLSSESMLMARHAVILYPTKAEYRDLLSRATEAYGDTSEALVQERLAVGMGMLWKDRYEARVKELEAKVAKQTPAVRE